MSLQKVNINMENLNLPIQVVNAILQYLGSRPYVEVSALITAIQKEAESQSKTEEAQNG
jgi:hypothetical protein